MHIVKRNDFLMIIDRLFPSIEPLFVTEIDYKVQGEERANQSPTKVAIALSVLFFIAENEYCMIEFSKIL